MNETARLVAALTIVSAAAGLVLAVAADVTREPIAQARIRAFESALREVLPAGATAIEKRTHSPADGGEPFEYHAAGDALAFVAESRNGYSGPIRLLVGFDGRDRLQSYKVLEHKETPGLGANITRRFRAQVEDRPARTTLWKVRQDNGDIDALTAATVSSRAVCEAIASAVERLAEVRGAQAGADD